MSRTFFPSGRSSVSAEGRGSGAGEDSRRGGAPQRGRGSLRGGHVQYSASNSTNARHIRRDDDFLQ